MLQLVATRKCSVLSCLVSLKWLVVLHLLRVGSTTSPKMFQTLLSDQTPQTQESPLMALLISPSSLQQEATLVFSPFSVVLRLPQKQKTTSSPMFQSVPSFLITEQLHPMVTFSVMAKSLTQAYTTSCSSFLEHQPHQI